ncbi:iron donor protein CyaY [Ectothiorhodospira marina]|jgi:CyaY protein|uniref:Iron-sulfur cluster assembly protein CyaY n=1 Tax=Ectothiorhodospira marina TaxID=1396821 RepID=A0A1H7MD80_9GAMM|nr:iron donor protein CyaY [Ectothiorhodospira marina]SEL09041.1 CyaY protein [Ectothiorhodospira marina]
MNQVSFSVQAEQTLEELMERMSAVDELADLDMDIVDGVLTIEFDDRSKLILNRQEPLRQIWLASPEGPAHFGYDTGSGQWLDDKEGNELIATLQRVLRQKLGTDISL